MRIKQALLSLSLILLSGSAFAAYVGSAEGTQAGGTTVVVGPVDTSGANFIACVVVVPSGNTATLADTEANSYSQHSSGTQVVSTVDRGYFFYVENAATDATHTITATINASSVGYMSCAWLSGRATASAIEAQAYAVDGGATVNHSGGATGAYTAGSDVLFAAFDGELHLDGRNLTWTQVSPWTLQTTAYNSDCRFWPCGGIGYIDAGAGTTVTAQWTTSATNVGGAFVMAVKAASASTGLLLRRRRN